MDESGVVLRPCGPEDLAEVLELLRGARLPVDGVSEGWPGFVVAESAGRIVGVAGLERYGRYGLLRSVAVSPGTLSCVIVRSPPPASYA